MKLPSFRVVLKRVGFRRDILLSSNFSFNFYFQNYYLNETERFRNTLDFFHERLLELP